MLTAEATRVSPLRRVTRSAATTPGRLSVIAVGLVVLTLFTGLFGGLTLQTKQDTLDELVDHREPLTAAAQLIYRSLSDADATAASAFLSGGVEPAALRTRYEYDIAQAGAALGKASSDVGDDSLAAEQVNVLSQQLPVYTGLIETARTNNRQGFPAGAAYLREASGLMRAKILPAAEKLYEIDFDRLKAGQAEARSFPWFTLLLTAGLLGALIATQLYLTRKTNRLINVGLLVASVAVGVALVWGTVALLVSSAQVADGERNGSDQVDVLVQARINSLKCRADETLTLVARGDGPGYEKEWKELAVTFSGDGDGNLLHQAQALASSPALSGEVQQAVENADAWVAAHRKIRELDDGGQYEGAVAMAIGGAPDSAATAFGKLDKNMITALNAGREEFFIQTKRGGQALTGLVPGVAILALLAAAGVALGIRERLREYR
ncbi:secreted protein [Alloactinosynnema sp. L-07]|nr:secreted protein [Alloactinosynnema sp. L-07]